MLKVPKHPMFPFALVMIKTETAEAAAVKRNPKNHLPKNPNPNATNQNVTKN